MKRSIIFRAVMILIGFSGVLFVAQNIQGLSFLPKNLAGSPANSLLLLFFGSALVIAGHALRIQRTRMLLSAAGVSSTYTQQIPPLAVGLMVNAVLPLKLGEIGRALLISRNLRISKTYSLVVVALERLLDVAFASLLFLWATAAMFERGSQLFALAVSAALISIALITLLVLTVIENKGLFKLIQITSSLFNKELETRLKHSTWSLIHGFQVFIRSPKSVFQYSLVFLTSWGFYLSAVAVVALSVFQLEFEGAPILAPFVVAANFLTSQFSLDWANSLSQALGLISNQDLTVKEWSIYGQATWIVLQGPVIISGIISVCWYLLSKGKTHSTPEESFSRIDKNHAPPRNLHSFIDLYFGRERLARDFHEQDVLGKARIVGFFRGGSDAVTALIRQDSEYRVRKMVEITHLTKLKSQFEWLRRNQSTPHVVTVLDERTTKNLYSYDLAFNSDTVTFFDWIFSHDVEQSKNVLKEAIGSLVSNVYQLGEETTDESSLALYLETRLFARLERAKGLSPQLKEISKSDLILINGIEYLNLDQVIFKIVSNRKSFLALAKHRNNFQMHGDLTVDNILVELKSSKPVIIDPSDDNEFRSTALDFARLRQSLGGGYEFLNGYAGEPRVQFQGIESKSGIEFNDFRTSDYKTLDAFVTDLAGNLLTPSEVASIDFFTGVFFARMLDHRVKINPKTAVLYYAQAVIFLNRYLEDSK